MKKYYGNHIGIVIQNNDPDKAGKVKVFVPHISSTIYIIIGLVKGKINFKIYR